MINPWKSLANIFHKHLMDWLKAKICVRKCKLSSPAEVPARYSESVWNILILNIHFTAKPKKDKLGDRGVVGVNFNWKYGS